MIPIHVREIVLSIVVLVLLLLVLLPRIDPKTGIRPRPYTLLLLLTIPAWFVPGLLIWGWAAQGRQVARDYLPALRWALFGVKP